MSAIFGIYHRNGRPVDRADLVAMQHVLAHRGPDDSALWSAGSIGLGHHMLRTTPEAAHEQLPLVQRAGELVLTGDVRLDNRAELIAALKIGDRPADVIPDGELVLAAYERWQERCPEHLLGDFAFAIWDGCRQELFCARDHFGVKPLYYYVCDNIFVFSTEIKALFTLYGVPKVINELRVGLYLAALAEDPESTFYKNISRLPPAHALTISCRDLRVSPYWDLDPSRELYFAHKADYAEAFRELFSAAVRSRLRIHGSVGSLLSGGLDSSSVTNFARQIYQTDRQDNLRTFSAVFDVVKVCDERQYIEQVLAQGGLESCYVVGDNFGPFHELEKMVWHCDEPFLAPGLYLNRLLYRKARELNVSTLLDGDDGDGVVSHGLGYLVELARAGQLPRLALELHGTAQVFGESYLMLLWAYTWTYFLRSRLPQHKIAGVARRALRHLNRRRSSATVMPVWSTLLPVEFVQQHQLHDHWREQQRRRQNYSQSERLSHYFELSTAGKAGALEVLDKTAGAFGLEVRHPFWDRRIVEFCLALPPQQKLNNGWGRLVVRQAMSNDLPEKIAWRKTKNDFLPNLKRGMVTYHADYLQRFLYSEADIVGHYVDRAALKSVYQRLREHPSDVTPHETFLLWQAVVLGCWIEQNKPGHNQASAKPPQRHTRAGQFES